MCKKDAYVYIFTFTISWYDNRNESNPIEIIKWFLHYISLSWIIIKLKRITNLYKINITFN